MTILREQLIPTSNAHKPRTSDRYDMQRDTHVSCYFKTYIIELFIFKGNSKRLITVRVFPDVNL